MAIRVSTADGRRLLRTALRGQTRGLMLGVTAGLLWTAGKVSVPLLIRFAIDQVASGRGSVAFWPLIVASAGVVAGVFTGARRWYAFREARWTETVLRDRLFAHVQRLHFAFHDEARTGQLMSRANTDLQQVQAFVLLIPITVANAATVAVAAAVMLFTNPLLALLAVAPLPALNVLARRFSSRLHPVAMAIQAQSADLADVVEETVSGIRVVKGVSAEGRQANRLRQAADGVYGASIEAAQVRTRHLPTLDLLPSLGLVAVLAYGGQLVLDGRLTIGQLTAFNAYVALMVWPLRSLGQVVAQYQRALASCQRVQAVLATEPAITSQPGARSLPPGDRVGRVEFREVAFGYGAGLPVLDGLDLVVEAGESVALVGATGSGKTTVARLIPRFYDVERGAVLVDGVDVRDLELHELRRAVGIVFEDTFLFNASIRDNIAFADPTAADRDVVVAARLAGAHEFVSRLPDQYDTLIGERGLSLSGGQRQRIAIARAILADPRVLILDDATSAVDPTKEHEIRDALAIVMQGRTTVVIAHRPATIALADRVVLLDSGRATASGTHQELLATSEAYRTVLASAEAAEEAR